MLDRLLLSFSNSVDGIPGDMGQKLGHIGLGLLQIGFGKTIQVTNAPNKTLFENTNYSFAKRIVTIALFIFAYKVTVPLALIGLAGRACSISHALTYNRYLENREVAATKFQKIVRGYQARKNYNTLKNEKAATTIQQLLQAYKSRQKLLSKKYGAQIKKISEAPQASGGKTAVYLPPEMPEVVFKASGRRAAIDRLYQMKAMQSVLDEQKCTHLVVPKANLYRNFLVEDRLPIKPDDYHNMALYLSQPKLFDEAVRELTRVFSKVTIYDLTKAHGSSSHPHNHLDCKFGSIRYDNLPLYVVEENGTQVGKFGLIDLESLREGGGSGNLRDLAQMFPYHLEVIKQEARRLNMEFVDSELDGIAEEGKIFFKLAYQDYSQWIQRKGNSASSSPLQIGPEQIAVFTNIVERELLNLIQGRVTIKSDKTGDLLRDFPITDPEQTVKELARAYTEVVINNLNRVISNTYKWDLEGRDPTNLTETELLELRSPLLFQSDIFGTAIQILYEHPNIGDSSLKTRGQAQEIAGHLLEVITAKLEQSGQCFSCRHIYQNTYWIRY
jgi:hypothetical protein